MKLGAETTHLWACVNQVESMNAPFPEQDCFGPNQVLFFCHYLDIGNLGCYEFSDIVFEANSLQERILRDKFSFR